MLVFSVCELQADVIHSSWVGPEDGQWDDASNWEPSIVPNNSSWRTFTVTIDSNSIGTDEINIQLQNNRTVDRLDTYGVVQLLCWPSPIVWFTVTDNVNGLTNHGKFNLDDGFGLVGNIASYGELNIEAEAEVEGNITNYGDMEISEGVEISGNITNLSGARILVEDSHIDGNFYNDSNATLRIDHEFDVHEGGLENAGLIIVESGANLWAEQYFDNTGHIQLMGGKLGGLPSMSVQGVIDNKSPGEIVGFGVIEAKKSIQNKGTILASSGSLLLYSEGGVTNTGLLGNKPLALLHVESAEAVNNTGTIEVNAGGGVSFNCNLTNQPDATVKLLVGTLAAQTITQLAGPTFEGFGGITADVVIDPNGIIRLTGPTNIVGNVTIENNAVLEVSDGSTLITGQTTCNGIIHMKGGRIIPQGGLSGDCSIIWEAGTYANIADFNLDGTVDFKDFTVFADTWLWQTRWY
jgi:hypothetical protein